MYRYFFKRFFDIVLSFIGIVVLMIPMLIIALLIKIDDPGPALFRQKRVGIHKTYFNFYKFRSMRVDTPDVPSHLLKNADQYISRVGRLLRRSSLDELPQLFNILSGKMSIIGPRPALWSQADLVAERDKYGVNDIRPGLTGWAQINGRDEIGIPLKAKLDGDYAERLKAGRCRGFLMDFKCFFCTIASILKADGIVEGGAAEAEAEMERESAEKVSVEK